MVTQSVSNEESPVLVPHAGVASGAHRERVAAFFLLNIDKVMRRIRGEVKQANGKGGVAAMSCLMDTDDVLSSVWRRIDREAEADRLRTRSEKEIWAYIYRVVANVVSDRRRRGVVEQRVFSSMNHEERSWVKARVGEELDQVMLHLARASDSDRELAGLMARGVGHRAAAEYLGLTLAAMKKRWSRLCADLRGRG